MLYIIIKYQQLMSDKEMPIISFLNSLKLSLKHFFSKNSSIEDRNFEKISTLRSMVTVNGENAEKIISSIINNEDYCFSIKQYLYKLLLSKMSF